MFSNIVTKVIFLYIYGIGKCENLKKGSFTVVQNWPEYQNFGQVSGIAIDASDNVYVFHRRDRVWDYSTFTSDNVFVAKDEGPIVKETIAVLDSWAGSLLTETGSNLFYLPHGLTIDHNNNIWVTDVALHQVFKFPPIKIKANRTIQLETPLLTLGVALEPGDDDIHFCKPTDVAVDKETNDFFISDGYCNARIIKYNVNGKKLLSWGRNTIGGAENDFYMLNVPHSLALAQSKTNTLYVADRENFRVIAYDSENGKFKKVYPQGLRNRTFSVVHFYNAKADLIFILIHEATTAKLISVQNSETKEIEFNSLSENLLTNPHDIILSSSGKFCYVVELYPYKVWKFQIDLHLYSKDLKKVGKVISDKNDMTGKTKVQSDKLNSIKQLEGSSTYLAVGLVASVVIVSFILFMFHYSKRRGIKRFELKRLILDDDDEPSADETFKSKKAKEIARQRYYLIKEIEKIE